MSDTKFKLLRIAVGLSGTTACLISTFGLWDVLPTTFGIPLLGIFLIAVSLSFTAWGLGWFDEEQED